MEIWIIYPVKRRIDDVERNILVCFDFIFLSNEVIIFRWFGECENIYVSKLRRYEQQQKNCIGHGVYMYCLYSMHCSDVHQKMGCPIRILLIYIEGLPQILQILHETHHRKSGWLISSFLQETTIFNQKKSYRFDEPVVCLCIHRTAPINCLLKQQPTAWVLSRCRFEYWVHVIR